MSDRLLAATRKGLFDIRRGPDGGWAPERVSFLGSPVSATLADSRDGALYAALDLGHFGAKLHRSDDGGQSWEEIAAPSYEAVGGDPPPSLKLIWTLEAGGPDEPGALWAGTIPGGLFRSEDCGRSWSLVRSLWDDPLRAQWMGGGYDQPGIHSICVDPRDSRRLAVGVSCGGVWRSADRGESWTIGGKGLWAEYVPPEQRESLVVQDVHRLVCCRAAPDHFWVQHHNGAFRATAGIDRWTEIKPTPSTFGFAVAAHPTRPDTAWFVPAADDAARYPVDGRVVVARTTDGGASFQEMTEGLPQRDAYDLVYRHALDVDASGGRLAMGSTTGNLWLSETGGDRWNAVSHHLPPILAVRFA